MRSLRLLTAAAVFAAAPNVASAIDVRSGPGLCQPGPLSAYLNLAGVGCRMGALHLTGFAQVSRPGLEHLVRVTPFTMQGPPGYTWHGFSLRFDKGYKLMGEEGFSFSYLSSGSPLFGLSVNNDKNPTPRYNINGTLSGDGGLITAQERKLFLNYVLTTTKSACQTGSVCATGTSQWVTFSGLSDGDGTYDVRTTQSWAGTQPTDYSVVVLTPDALVTPEPATMMLLATGLFGVGFGARRRRRETTS